MPDEITKLPAADVPAGTVETPSTPADAEPEKTYTQADLTRVGTQEAKKAKAAIYAKLAVKDDTELENKLAIIKSYEEAQAKAELEKPEIEQLRTGMTAAEQRAAEAEAKAAELEAKLTVAERKTYLQGKGYTGRELKLALMEIDELITDGEEWTAVADKYVIDNPIAPSPPQMATGTGRHQVGKKPIDMNKLLFSKLSQK